MRTLALSTLGLLITLAGCGGGGTPGGTGAGTSGSGSGGAATTSSGSAAGGSEATGGAGGTSPNPGGAVFGAPCAKNSDCASLLCVDTDATHAICTKPCADAAACPPAPEWSCATKAGSALLCICQPSGPEICDGKDNDCDGVVDGGDCPELVVTLDNTIADLKASGTTLFYVTDKTIEKLDTKGGAPVVLRTDAAGVQALAATTKAILWVQGTLRQMDYLGNAAPEVTVTTVPPATRMAATDTYSFYGDQTGIRRTMAGLNKLFYGLKPGDMALGNDVLYWYASGTIYQVPATADTSVGTTAIAMGQPAPVMLAASADAVYWAGSNASIRKATLPGYTISDVATGEPGITGFAVDATNLYWASGDGVKSTLWKQPIAGGAKAKLGALPGVAQHLVPSGKYVYFETGKQLWRSAM